MRNFFAVMFLLPIVSAPLFAAATSATKGYMSAPHLEVIGWNNCEIEGRYIVAFGKDAACHLQRKECVLSAKPMDYSTISVLIDEYGFIGFDNNGIGHVMPFKILKVHFPYEAETEHHCGWPSGTIHRAYLKSLKLGGFTDENNHSLSVVSLGHVASGRER